MKILLTGATGFLGSHLLEALIKKGHSIVCLKRETSDMRRVEENIENCKWVDVAEVNLKQLFVDEVIECVIHCATDYGRKQLDPLEIIDANIILPLKLLYASEGSDLSLFINTDTILDKRVSHYSLSKKQFSEWLKAYSGSMTLVNLALEHFYGPFDDQSKFVSLMLNNLIDNKEGSIDLTEGLQERDFIHINDVVNAFMTIIDYSPELDKSYYHFEVGSNKPVAIRNFVELVKELCNNDRTKLNFGVLPYRENETMNSQADTSFLKSKGWIPKISLEEGLKMTIIEEKESN